MEVAFRRAPDSMFLRGLKGSVEMRQKANLIHRLDPSGDLWSNTQNSLFYAFNV